MGFIRQQQVRLAARYLQWQYQKLNLPLPTPLELERQAQKIIEEAGQIALQRGQNVVVIMKEMVAEIKRNR